MGVHHHPQQHPPAAPLQLFRHTCIRYWTITEPLGCIINFLGYNWRQVSSILEQWNLYTGVTCSQRPISWKSSGYFQAIINTEGFWIRKRWNNGFGGAISQTPCGHWLQQRIPWSSIFARRLGLQVLNLCPHRRLRQPVRRIRILHNPVRVLYRNCKCSTKSVSNSSMGIGFSACSSMLICSKKGLDVPSAGIASNRTRIRVIHRRVRRRYVADSNEMATGEFSGDESIPRKIDIQTAEVSSAWYAFNRKYICYKLQGSCICTYGKFQCKNIVGKRNMLWVAG